MRYIFLLTVLIISFSTCKKDEDCPPDLPCATQIGENTFGCYINGMPWVAKIEPFIFDPTAHKLEASYDETDYGTFNDNYMRLLGVYQGDSYSSIIIHCKPLLGPGKIDISSLNFYGIRFRNSNETYEIDKSSNYEINITKLDLEKNILSGTFFFKAINNMDTISITDGRFDVKYSQE